MKQEEKDQEEKDQVLKMVQEVLKNIVMTLTRLALQEVL